MEHFTAMKKDEKNTIFSNKDDLEIIILSEVSQTE